MFTMILDMISKAIVMKISLVSHGIGGQSGRDGIRAGPMNNNAGGNHSMQDKMRIHFVPRRKARCVPRTSTPATPVYTMSMNRQAIAAMPPSDIGIVDAAPAIIHEAMTIHIDIRPTNRIFILFVAQQLCKTQLFFLHRLELSL